MPSSTHPEGSRSSQDGSLGRWIVAGPGVTIARRSCTWPPRGWLTGRAGGRPWCLSRTKRYLDASLSVLLLLTLSPLLILLAVLIKLESPGPVFFRQWRTGHRCRRFRMFKFRSMVADAEALKERLQHLNRHSSDIDFKVIDDPRVTRIGKFLRRYSLDELPNLINVVTGDMRLVGPRPTSFSADRLPPMARPSSRRAARDHGPLADFRAE